MQFTSTIGVNPETTWHHCFDGWRNVVCTIAAVLGVGVLGMGLLWVATRALKRNYWETVVKLGVVIVHIAGVFGLISLIMLSAGLASAAENYTVHFNTLFAHNASGWDMLRGTTEVYENTVGAEIFWTIFISMPFIALYIKQKSVIIPSALFLIGGGILMCLVPAALDVPARIMFTIGIVGVCWHVMIKRR